MFLITGLALYKALYDEFRKQEELIERVRDILWKGPMSKLIRFLASFIVPISIPPVRLVDENNRQSRAGEA